MKINSGKFNIGADFVKAQRQGRFALQNNSPSFGSAQKVVADIAQETVQKAGAAIGDEVVETVDTVSKKVLPKIKDFVSDIFQKTKGKTVKIVKEQVTSGCDIKYEYLDETLQALRKNFGSTFDDCISSITEYENLLKETAKTKSGKLGSALKASGGHMYKIDEKTNTITFHKTPFAKNIWSGIKDFTVGTVLDACIGIRNGWRKISPTISTTGSKNKSGTFGAILDQRVVKKKAMDSFYKLSGVFEESKTEAQKIKELIDKGGKEALDDKTLIRKGVESLAGKSVKAATKKVGKYNTKSERAWNRLGTGFVSATFAATDFYNISMLQKDDKNEANASARKRFAQDMRRQGLTAAITYIVLGAFQNKVNNSIAYAALSLGGVTLLSEVLSRKMGGISLTPLSPEEAAQEAEKKARKQLKKEQKHSSNKKEDTQPKTEPKASEEKTKGLFPSTMSMPVGFVEPKLNNKKDDVFNIFTEKMNNSINNSSPAFTADKTLANNEEKPKKKKSGVLATAGKIAGGIVASVLAIGFLRSKNIGKCDDIIKTISKKYNKMVKTLTTKELVLPKGQVDEFLQYLKRSGFTQQHEELQAALKSATAISGTAGSLTGESSVIKKLVSKKELIPNGEYYHMGRIESKGKKVITNVLLYPINTLSRLFKSTNNLVKKIFVKDPKVDKAERLSQEAGVALIKNYSEKYQKAVTSGNLDKFQKELQDSFSRHFSEANSKNKNTSIAMISRFLITFISGYFFVNDYRNEVLIESKGKDVERANATMKERIGHKISNFFLNSMFMDLFNTTFENIYLGSVVGATAVAMATEFTNESAVRASICTPTKKMNKEELIQYEKERLENDGPKGTYYKTFMKLTGKKPLSEKAKK